MRRFERHEIDVHMLHVLKATKRCWPGGTKHYNGTMARNAAVKNKVAKIELQVTVDTYTMLLQCFTPMISSLH